MSLDKRGKLLERFQSLPAQRGALLIQSTFAPITLDGGPSSPNCSFRMYTVLMCLLAAKRVLESSPLLGRECSQTPPCYRMPKPWRVLSLVVTLYHNGHKYTALSRVYDELEGTIEIETAPVHGASRWYPTP